tara:strand:+ start:337 stop:657 length:321 start_codon:yes stop_codon:yes gene_type:complete
MFFIGMIVGMHVGYTIRVIMRSEHPDIYDPPTGVRQILSTLTFPAWISIFIWGFINLPWYVVIIWFLICALVITPIVFNKIPLERIFYYKPHSEALLLLLGLLVWV